jgi:hypothetical protein
MATVLPLINDLHSEAIRPRHWSDVVETEIKELKDWKKIRRN